MNNWIDYGLFWLYKNIHERYSLAYLMPIPVFSLFSWFLYCNTPPSVRKAWNLTGTSLRNGRRFFILFIKNYYFIEKLHVFLLKSDSDLPKEIYCICFIESPLKMMQNAFYFILKALFVLKIFKFMPSLYGHVEKTAWLEGLG